MTQQGSPYTPPVHRNKSDNGRFGRNRGVLSNVSSNVVLTTLGSIHPDMDIDIEQDMVEMDDIRLGLGMHLGSLSTAIGGDDGEPLPEGESNGGSPAPAYHSLEMGFRGRRTPSLEEGVRGIRVDVEMATKTM